MPSTDRKKHPRTIAKEAGEPFYYTGQLCKQGHDSKRMTKNGSCKECDNTYKAARRIKTRAARAAKGFKPYMKRTEKAKEQQKVEEFNAMVTRVYKRNQKW